MERPPQAISFQALHFTNVDAEPRERSERVFPLLATALPASHKTSYEMGKSFELLPGSSEIKTNKQTNKQKLELGYGEAETGMAQSALSVHGHLGSMWAAESK